MDMSFVKRDAQGVVICATCVGLEWPASHVATYEKTDGSGRGAWALCKGHAPYGLIAWGALTPLADFLAAHPADAVAAPLDDRTGSYEGSQSRSAPLNPTKEGSES